MFVQLNAESVDGTSSKKRKQFCCVVITLGLLLAVAVVIALYFLGVLDAISDSNSSNNSHNNNNNGNENYIYLNTSLGTIKGNILSGPSAFPIETGSVADNNNSNNTNVYEFLGVRYGQAPIGDLRFRPCVLNNDSWNENVYDATEYGNICPQPTNDTQNGMDEDCLFLNIWTPASAVDNDNDDTHTNTESLLPVMIFIHGGSFLFGSGADVNGSLFIKQGNNNVVYVSINYRMGVFGFLQSEMLFNEGNSNTYGYNWPSYGGCNGLNDQISAIKWVYYHIHNFGGNNQNITIFGESAGGQSVCSLIISPLLYNTNWFYQAIVESGPCFGPWKLHPYELGTRLNNEALTTGTIYGEKANNLTFLRSLSMQDLLNNVQRFNNVTWPWDQWWPTIDKWILTDDIDSMYKVAAYNDISKINVKRLIWGFNSQDSIIGCPCPNTTSNVTMSEILMSYFNNNETIVDIIMNDYYPVSDYYGNESSAYYALNSDVCVICPMLNVNNMFLNGPFVENDKFKQYSYYFEGTSYPYYAGHGAELVFLMLGYLPLNASNYGMSFNKTLSQQMINAWQTFANISDDEAIWKNGFRFYNPENELDFEWFEYNKTTKGSVLRLNQNISNVFEFRNETHRHGACKFWNEHVNYQIRFNLCSNTHYYNTTNMTQF